MKSRKISNANISGKHKRKWTKIGDKEYYLLHDQMNYSNSQKECEKLGGILPNLDEFKHLYQYYYNEIQTWPPNNFWSGTECHVYNAYYVNFCNGYVKIPVKKEIKCFVVCMRDAKPKSISRWRRIGNLEWSDYLGSMYWEKARNVCRELGGRLPTKEELIDLEKNHEDEISLWGDIYDAGHWSSTEGYDCAYRVSLDCGFVFYQTKVTGENTRCVREINQNSYINWIRINDREWSEDLGPMNWYDAQKKCEELGGRLPTREEIRNLRDNKPIIIYFGTILWSATENDRCCNPCAYIVYLNECHDFLRSKYKEYLFRCIRKIEKDQK